jgi:hypothetical protein
MKEHITIDFGLDGSVKVEGHHFQGGACEKATKFLDEALGRVSKRKRKPEFYQQHGTQAKAQQ